MATSNDNPWADQESTTNNQHHPGRQGIASQQVASSQNPWQLTGAGQNTPQQHQQQHPSYTAPADPWSQQQQHQQQSYQPHQQGHQQSAMQYTAPPGPPPAQVQNAPRLADETARFVPDAERGEQREALEHFEMSRHQPPSSDEQNIDKLTHEFPMLDSALVAAIYGDSKDMGASREMLTELADQMKG